ncbi:MAG: glycosyltransferase family 4 protein, partial [Candidatus Hodarchaeota archaeon]
IKISNCVNKFDIKTKVYAHIGKMNLSIASNTKIIGSAGRLVTIKGYNYLIYAAKKILEKMPNIKFIIAGEGPVKQDLIKETEKLGILENFIFTGFVEDIYTLISTFDLFVMPSVNEGIPIVLLETMVLGIPIIATKVGGIPEILTHRINGLLVAPGDISELATTCLYALKKSNKIRLMAENAREHVAKEFSPQKIAKQTSELYQTLINNDLHDEAR